VFPRFVDAGREFIAFCHSKTNVCIVTGLAVHFTEQARSASPINTALPAFSEASTTRRCSGTLTETTTRSMSRRVNKSSSRSLANGTRCFKAAALADSELEATRPRNSYSASIANAGRWALAAQLRSALRPTIPTPMREAGTRAGRRTTSGAQAAGRNLHHRTVYPPSAVIAAPVMNDASSLARNRARFASSDGSAMRRCGVAFLTASMYSAGI
jgi:hypothetical protein